MAVGERDPFDDQADSISGTGLSKLARNLANRLTPRVGKCLAGYLLDGAPDAVGAMSSTNPRRSTSPSGGYCIVGPVSTVNRSHEGPSFNDLIRICGPERGPCIPIQLIALHGHSGIRVGTALHD